MGRTNRTVTLANGQVLTGTAAENYGRTSSTPVLTQGQSYQGGIVNYDTATGRRLGVGQTTAITPQDLSGSATPFNVQPPRPSTGASNFITSIGIASEETTKAKETAASLVDTSQVAQQKVNDATWGSRIAGILRLPGKTALTDQAYSNTVDPAKKELDNIQNQIRDRSRAATKQIEEIEKNPLGKEVSGLRNEVNRANKDNARELADLSIIEQAKLQNYSTAKEIADRKVAIELEDRSNELEALKFAYAENKEKLTKTQDREFQVMINEKERLLKADEVENKSINDIALNALQNGAPTSLVQQALKVGTQAEAIQLVGGYVDSLTRKKLLDDLNKKDDSSLTTQVLDGFTKFSDLNPTNQQKVRDKLYDLGFNKTDPPSWFKKYIEGQYRQSLEPSVVKTQWETYRKSIDLSTDKGAMDFENL